MNAVMTSGLASRPVWNTLNEMLALLGRWTEAGWLRSLDLGLATMLAREVPGAPPLAILAAALVSHQLGRGHACLDLQDTLGDPGFALSLPPEGGFAPLEGLDTPQAVLRGVGFDEWVAALDRSGWVDPREGARPLVREGSRLYLRRYWQYEQNVRVGVGRRLACRPARAGLPASAIRRVLDPLFPAGEGAQPDWQKLACALAARSAFSIITGGPGTGKTTTVVKLLALLQALALDADPGRRLRIGLAAPTGKAAARLSGSLAKQVAGLPLAGLAQAGAIRAAIPQTVTTLHRLLGNRPDSRRFRHHAGNPLPLDVLVVDEASMIDLEMMACVLAALPASATLVLLGDKDQLASVEAGAVLGELCQRANEGHYTAQTRDWLEAVTGQRIEGRLVDEEGTALDQAVAMLRHSYRFGARSGIGRLAEAVNAGDAAGVRDVLDGGFPDLQEVNLFEQGEGALDALILDGAGSAPGGGKAAQGETRSGYRDYLRVLREMTPDLDAPEAAFDDWARAVLAAHGRFQLLCALRQGPWGVEGLNRRVGALLHREGLIAAAEGWYAGRPVLVTRNDYGLGLMNGDIGIALSVPDGQGGERLRVAFPASDGQDGIKWVLPSRLQAIETVYALTVHKSQGSEFAHAVLVLPGSDSPVLTRDLIYTGITRAQLQFTLIHAEKDNVLARAVGRRVKRLSGLRDQR